MSSTYRIPVHPIPRSNDGDLGEANLKHQNEVLDEALMESFPASDPIAISVTCIVARALAPIPAQGTPQPKHGQIERSVYRER